MSDYLKRFINTRSAENLMPLFTKCGNPAKEITESWGMLEAVKKYCAELWRWKCIIVGDGRTPRTGAMIAFYTGADTVSVDPELNLEAWAQYRYIQSLQGIQIKRLLLMADKIEDISSINCDGKPVVVLWPHSHAPMNKCNTVNYAKRIDIALPCCVKIPKEMYKQPHIYYQDLQILSPKRDIHIWGTDLPACQAQNEGG